jgi:hypothetical protein
VVGHEEAVFGAGFRRKLIPCGQSFIPHLRLEVFDIHACSVPEYGGTIAEMAGLSKPTKKQPIPQCKKMLQERTSGKIELTLAG